MVFLTRHFSSNKGTLGDKLVAKLSPAYRELEVTPDPFTLSSKNIFFSGLVQVQEFLGFNHGADNDTAWRRIVLQALLWQPASIRGCDWGFFDSLNFIRANFFPEKCAAAQSMQLNLRTLSH